MQDLIDYATAHGWGIKFRDLGRRNGHYANGLITINDRRRTGFTMRMTLAHEIGHAHHDHPWTDDPVERERYERAADVVAAHLLIDERAYRDAERLVGADPGELAKHLAVSERYIAVWRQTWPSMRHRLRPAARAGRRAS